MDTDTLPLRAFRYAQNPRLTLRALAEQVGVTEGQLSRVERGSAPSFELAIRLSDVTGLPLEAFAPKSEAA